MSFGVHGSATEGDDYEPLTLYATIPNGESSVTIDITPIDDGIAEGDETVQLILMDDPMYHVGEDREAEVLIEDDAGDLPLIEVGWVTPYAYEAETYAGAFVLTRTGSVASSLTVYYTVSGTATAGTDYSTLSGSVTFGAGDPITCVNVTPLQDSSPEPTETIILTLSTDAAYVLGDVDEATIQLLDNDSTVAIFAPDDDAAETGNDIGQITFTRSGNLADAMVVFFSVSGTATEGVDYEPLFWYAVIEASEASVTIDLNVIDDDLIEGSETVIVTLETGPQYSIDGDDSVTITIADDVGDDTPVVTIEATDPGAAETGSDDGVFTVTRTGSTSAALIVYYEVGGWAKPGDDYTELTGTVTIPIGESSATITVSVVDDDWQEGDESVEVWLVPDEEETYAIGEAFFAEVVIADDEEDEDPVVTVYASSADETGLQSGYFFVHRTGDLTNSLTVNFAISGTATPDVDYDELAGSVAIPAEEDWAAVAVALLEDEEEEDDESVILTLTASANYDFDFAETTLFIADTAKKGLNEAKQPKGVNYIAVHEKGIKGEDVRVGIIELGAVKEKDDVKKELGILKAQTQIDNENRLLEELDYSVATLPPNPTAPMAVTEEKDVHATIMAEIIASADAEHTGVAPKAKLRVAYLGAMDRETTFTAYRRILDLFTTRTPNNDHSAFIINQSFRLDANADGSGDQALFADWIARTRDAVLVASSGNTGKDDKQLGTPGDAFNAITVGGLDYTFTRMHEISSYLLTPDVKDKGKPDKRAKPDVVAPAATTDNNLFHVAGKIANGVGTSNATALVTGISALLAGKGLTLGDPAQHNHLAHKAIILNSARKRGMSLMKDAEERDFAKSYDYRGAEASDYNYLKDGLFIAASKPSGDNGKTNEWTPSDWSVEKVKVGNKFFMRFTTTSPLDDEQGTGVADAQRALFQFESGRGKPISAADPNAKVKPVGWNVGDLRIPDNQTIISEDYKIDGTFKPGQFITVTLAWDRIIDRFETANAKTVKAEGEVDSDDDFKPHSGNLSYLPNFDLQIRKGDTVIANSFGKGGYSTDRDAVQNVEHLHIPVPDVNIEGDYVIRVILRKDTEFASIKDNEPHSYGLAWWVGS